jgi:hypothetical protein
MQFTQPILLWALAGLMVPLAIHLLSRKEGQVIRLGSLRHLRETNTQQFRGIKLNEILLLVLRSLLVILFVLLISGLYWSNAGGKRWIVVEKGIEEIPTAKKLIDSLEAQGFERRVLQNGFPLENISSAESSANNWHLIESLQQQELTQAIVLSQSRAEDFTGARRAVNSNIQWITFPTEAHEFNVEAIQQTPDRILIRKGFSNAAHTHFETVQANSLPPDSIAIKELPTVSILLVSDVDFATDKMIIMAALDAITKTLSVKINLLEATPETVSEVSSDWLIWLSEKNFVANDSVKVITSRLHVSPEIVEQVSQNHWELTKRITIETAREGNLTLRLATLLIDERVKWSQIAHHDRRTLPESILFAGKSRPTKVEAGVVPPVNKYLILLLIIILLIERLVAYHRNQ